MPKSICPTFICVASFCNYAWFPIWNEQQYLLQASSINKMLIIGITIHTRKESLLVYHSRKCKPRLFTYLAQMIYLKTWKLGLIDKLSQLGICISRDRLVQISAALGNKAIKQYSVDLLYKLMITVVLPKWVWNIKACYNDRGLTYRNISFKCLRWQGR